MKNSPKALAKRVLYSAGYYDIARKLQGRRAPRLVVAMYHDLLDDVPSSHSDHTDTESPTAAQFAAHVEQISRRYRTLALRDAAAEILAGGLKEDTVAITFDDGYASVHRSAYPALKRFGVPATIFVLTGWINSERHMWWQELRTIATRSTFSRAAVRRIEAILGVPIASGWPTSVLDIRRRFLEAAEPWLRDLDEVTIASHLDDLREAALPGLPPLSVRDQALTWDQLREMSDDGIELAAHTHHHINLRHSDSETAAHEIMKSKAVIEQETGQIAVGFAYPYGKDIDQYATAADILRTGGFTYACTALFGSNDSQSDLFYLRRIVVPSTTSTSLINRVLSTAFLKHA